MLNLNLHQHSKNRIFSGDLVDYRQTVINDFKPLLSISFCRIVLEVGNRTKTHASDLARQVDILPDDIRNFLQRWIIVQVGT